ncbi:PrsW family intramembrane metalloprotease [Corynebacterium uterequi]|uniref:Protease prsW family n=1 Tax=Corynebacterium uterequi TaxID=1072256 RepID=A0A0G3HDW8_9CORY|nr:PrsW family intramembrane metalloprotease [Corynebacterium uterequi]AKK10113.1 Protease prsW family [Corynebacterium uterequi]
MKLFARILLGISTAVGVLMMLLNIGVNIVLSPMGFVVGLVCGLLYSLIIIFALTRTPLWPRMKRGSAWYFVISAFAWGGGTGMMIMLPTATAWNDMVRIFGWDNAAAAFSGAYPEEPAKAFGVLMILLAFRQLNRPWHGMLAGMLVGLGFETVENFGYGAMFGILDANSDLHGALAGWGLRLVVGPALHIVFTGVVGWGIGQALYRADKSLGWRLGQVFGWLAFSVMNHFLWNYGTEDMVLAIVTMIIAAVLHYPVFIWLFITAWRQARADHGYAYTDRPLVALPA